MTKSVDSAAEAKIAPDEVRASMRRLLTRFDPDYWRAVDMERRFPEAFLEAMAQAGYLGMLLPERYGGLELGCGAASVVVEEINRAGGDASVVHAQMVLAGVIARDGSDEQRKAYLPGIASGEIRLLTVAATEPDSGADMSQLESFARRDSDGWVVDARKVFISLAEHTHLMVVLVRTDEGPTLFLLDLRELGSQVEIRPIHLIAHRMTTTLFIDGLRVPDSARVGPAGQGLRVLMKGFAARRILAAAESIGNGRFFLDKSVQHAKQRRTFGRLIGENQGVQYPLAHAYAKVEAADLMRWDAVALLEKGEPAGGRAALAKVLASEAAWEAARAAMTTFGGWALASEIHVERKLRDATVFVFNNMLLSYISEKVLGLPKSF